MMMAMPKLSSNVRIAPCHAMLLAHAESTAAGGEAGKQGDGKKEKVYAVVGGAIKHALKSVPDVSMLDA